MAATAAAASPCSSQRYLGACSSSGPEARLSRCSDRRFASWLSRSPSERLSVTSSAPKHRALKMGSRRSRGNGRGPASMWLARRLDRAPAPLLLSRLRPVFRREKKVESVSGGLFDAQNAASSSSFALCGSSVSTSRSRLRRGPRGAAAAPAASGAPPAEGDDDGCNACEAPALLLLLLLLEAPSMTLPAAKAACDDE